jgi:hypothetical protein
VISFSLWYFFFFGREQRMGHLRTWIDRERDRHHAHPHPVHPEDVQEGLAEVDEEDNVCRGGLLDPGAADSIGKKYI